MSLLQKLQNALNKIYDGNTVSCDEAKQDGESYVDTYHCIGCDDHVKEDDWDSLHKCCKECWQDYQGEINTKYQER